MTTDQMTDAELADYYNSTHDLSKFDGAEVVTTPQAHPETRSITISVRFSPSELAEIEELASAAGIRLTAFIRAAALASEEPPVDRAKVLDLLTALRESVEGTKPRRVTGANRTASHTVHRAKRGAQTAARSAVSGRYLSSNPATTERTAASTTSGKNATAKASSKLGKVKRTGGKLNK